MSDTRERLRNVIVKALRLDRPPESVPDTKLASELGIDSIASLEILIWVENEFGIVIDDADLSVALLDSLDTMADYVDRKLAAGSVAPAPVAVAAVFAQ